MATPLSKPVSRLTAKKIQGKPVIVTIAPAGSQSEALITLRLKGQRTQYVAALSDVYRMAALWHGQKEAAAKRAARKAGVPWHKARKQFLKEQAIWKEVTPDDSTPTFKLPAEDQNKLPFTP